MLDSAQDLDNPNVFYCQVDNYLAIKDYLQGGRCVRLIAVRPHNYSADALSSGITTYTIDIDFWIFCAFDYGVSDWRDVPRQKRKEIEGRDDDIRKTSTWYRLEVAYRQRGKNYVYRTFSADLPSYFDAVSLTPLPTGPALPKPGKSRRATVIGKSATQLWPFPAANGTFYFDTFHVGQGMCSLIHDGCHGILLDAGAGKPVTRGEYPYLTSNDLISVVLGLKQLRMVVSHADSDHWRLIAWDSHLLTKIDEIYVPVDTNSLAMQDKAVNKKIYRIGDTTWHLNQNTTLQLWRSKPSADDENGRCLVAVFNRGGDQVLAPGDYTYRRFKSDTNPGINALHNSMYCAVVVPHHGDKESAHDVVAPTGVAKAFFSAGTHKSWCHPTTESLDAHLNQKYNNISHPAQSDIVKVNLI